MIYENDIPEYALQPARAPKSVPADAVWQTEKTVCPAAFQTVTYQFEEDILVPDIKPDMREILLMDASCDLVPTEKKISPKADDLLNLTGTVTVQTIYGSESDETEPVSITSAVPYKYQWSLNPPEQGEGLFGCRVRNLESMIVNERKFRVKITLEFTGQLFCRQEFAFFRGLSDESLEMKQLPLSLSCLELVKNDEVSVDETFPCRDTSLRPEYILKQDFVVTENYRQVTSEKVVINGFIYCSLLYAASAQEGEDERSVICQQNQRIEFTQFIPVEKEHRGKNWNTVKTFFSGRDLAVTIDCGEEEEGTVQFRVRGRIKTRAELYGTRSLEVVADAYHREKNFQFRTTQKRVSNIADAAAAEISLREMISLPEGTKAAEAVYGSGKILDCQCICERGRIAVSGSAACCVLWKDRDGRFHAAQAAPAFRGTVDMEDAQEGQTAACIPVIKNVWTELINEKQISINCTIQLCAERYEETAVPLIEQPYFAEKAAGKEYPMVSVTLKKGESLWDLAKRYRTTESKIRTANNLSDEPAEGTRLLIIR